MGTGTTREGKIPPDKCSNNTKFHDTRQVKKNLAMLPWMHASGLSVCLCLSKPSSTRKQNNKSSRKEKKKKTQPLASRLPALGGGLTFLREVYNTYVYTPPPPPPPAQPPTECNLAPSPSHYAHPPNRRVPPHAAILPTSTPSPISRLPTNQPSQPTNYLPIRGPDWSTPLSERATTTTTTNPPGTTHKPPN